ncbi:hypothetical protein SDC9_137563 [bioreactor metagenome]|uniref:Uncharacterized protein n=1 Tax=bioreactor metagenome TaxID=1076179 RepID=A0A645DPP0_9ZZZZ
MRMIVLVESEKSILYASDRMITSERNAKPIASTMVPANGRFGIVMPNAMAITAPSDAPLETPSVLPSASGLRSKPCMAAPQSESAAPVSATHSTRGRRTERMIETAMESGCGRPNTAFQMTVNVSETGMPTLPAETQNRSVATAASENSAICAAL